MKTILSVILCCLSFLSFAQNTECDSLFSRSIALYNDEKIDSSLSYWLQIVHTFSDTSSCYKNSLHNIPLVYEQLEDFENAKLWITKILEKDLNNFDPGTGIMEPYANYHHNACMQMARILSKEKKYEEGLNYLLWAETKYPYETFSATSFEKRAVSIAMWKAEFYLENNQKEKAIWVLVNKAIDVDVFFRKPDWGGFTSVDFYSRISQRALDLIDEVYGFDSFKEAFNEALQKVKTERAFIEKNGKQTKAKIGMFILYGNSYRLGSSDKKFNAAKFKKQIQNTRFWTMLKEKESAKS